MRSLSRAGLREASYGGPLRRHVLQESDLRLRHLRFDNSAASLRLWNFLLTENERLAQARAQGNKIVGTMKDLGTVPVMAYSLAGVRAFYPDGAWWTPCLMECSDGLLQQAETFGIDASFCPVRAMLPAFVNGEHFPRPDLLDLQHRGCVRRLLGHRPAAGEDGLPNCVVGNASPSRPRARGNRMRASWRLKSASDSSRLRARRIGAAGRAAG